MPLFLQREGYQSKPINPTVVGSYRDGLVMDCLFSEGTPLSTQEGVSLNLLTANALAATEFKGTPWGMGLNLNGSTQSYQVTGKGVNVNCNPLTFSMLLNTNTTSFAYLIDKGSNYFYCRINGSGQWEFQRFINTVNITSNTVATVSANTWYNVTVTWDGGLTANSNVAFWINGISTALNAGTNGSGGISSDAGQSPIYLFQSSSASQFLGGMVVYARVWNRVLNPAEIQAMYANPMVVYRGPKRTWFVPAAVGGVSFRRTLHDLGTRTGARQVM